LEEEFALTYCMEGMTWTCIQSMLSKQRIWHIKRLKTQLERENKKTKKK